jgi:predicted ester cyclase
LNTDLQKNKEIAAKYHKLNPSDIDVILTENFIGRNEKSRFTWNRENHRNYLSNGKFKTDSIFYQIAEGNWVATRFVRTMELNGDTVKIEAMHFKRFENGKIAEIWEYTDTKQVETEGK